MSDHIAHIGICDDTFRLALVHPGIHPVLKTLMDDQRDAAHMGCVTRGADEWSAEIIDHSRRQRDLPPDQRDPLAMSKVAFVLGSLTHRSADRLTKPITKCWKGNDDSGQTGSEANESKIMQDLFVFKEVFGNGQGPFPEPFTPDVLAPPTDESAANLERLFRLLLRRALIAMHTFNPDQKNIQPWLTSFLKGLQTYPKSLEQYAHLASSWDSAKVKKYLIDKNFYRRQDTLIRLARDIQRGSTVGGEQVIAAMSAIDKTHSRYARALAKAMEYLLAAGELFDGKIDRVEARRRFDVGVPELSIQE